MTAGRHAGGRGAFLGLAALILGGLVFAAGVMVGRQMGPEEQAQPDSVLQRIDRRDQGAASRDGGTLSFHRELNKPVAEPPPPVQQQADSHVPPPRDPAPQDPSEQAGSGSPGEVGEGDVYSLQVASYREQEQALQLSERLSGKGHSHVRLVEAEVPGKGVYFRVRLGRFTSREAAQEQAGHLLEQEGLKGLIVREE